MSKFIFTPSVEPLSSNADDTQEQMRLAESHAYRLLYRELLEYCKGNIGGRSILISGHRGSGKTTLVHKALQDVKHASKEARNLSTLLIVEVHGPSLLNPLKKAAIKIEGEEATDRKEQKSDPTVDALLALTLALYRCFSKEIVKKFRERKIDAGLVARLDLELENAARSSDLGYFWKKANLLEDEQGYKELIALDSASQAYRKVIGIISDKEEQTNKTENTSEIKNEFKTENITSGIQEVFKQIWSLIAGLAIGAGILSGDNSNGLIAAVGGLFTAILASKTFSFVSTRKKNKVYKRDITFIRDTSINTLNREIPLLIKRLKEAGYTPVFIIDELDKYLNNLEKFEYFKIRISELKHLIADRSFFCFLTDRNYYDYLSKLIRENPYPIEQTLFSRRLFVAYTSQDFHQYCNQLFSNSAIKTEQDLFQLQNFILLSLFHARYHIGDLKKYIESYLNGEIKKGFVVEMPRVLVEEVDTDVEKQSPFAIQIYIQLAIEYLLADEVNGIKVRLLQEPNFSQLIYDTLYFPVRKWLKGSQRLDTSKSAFRAYLDERMKVLPTETPLEVRLNETETIAADSAIELDNKEQLNDLDFEFLHSRMAKLILYLQEPNNFKAALKQSKIYNNFFSKGGIEFSEQNWATFCEKIIPEKGLLSSKANRVFHWNYDFHGRKLDILEEEKEKRMFRIVDSLLLLDSVLYNLTDKMYVVIKDLPLEIEQSYRTQLPELSVIKWGERESGFNDLLKTVLQFKNIGVWDNKLKEYSVELDNFWIVLENLIKLINRTLFFSDLILRLNKSLNLDNNKDLRLTEIFERIFTFFQELYEGVNPDNLETPLNTILSSPIFTSNELEFHLSSMSVPQTVNLLNFIKWKESVEQLIEQPRASLSSTDLIKIIDLRWNKWYDRIQRWMNQAEDTPIELTEVDFLFSWLRDFDDALSNHLWAIEASPHYSHVNLQRPISWKNEKFTRQDWTTLLIRSNFDTIKSDSNYVPFWLQLPAMLWLGLYSNLKEQMEYLEAFLKNPTGTLKKENSNPAFFNKKNIDEDWDKITQIFRDLRDRYSSTIYESESKTILLVVGDRMGDFNFGGSIEDNSGLLIIREKDLRAYGKERMLNGLSFFNGFSEYMIYCPEAKFETITDLLLGRDEKLITHFSPDSKLQDGEIDKSHTKSRSVYNMSRSEELHNHIRKTIHSNQFFR